MKKLFALILAALMLFTMAACGGTADNETTTAAPDDAVAADSDAAYIENKGELIIGITYFKPMNYLEGETLTGFETDFATAVCEKLGVTPKFQEIDWNSKEIELEAKNIDCIWNGMTITDDRLEAMSITTPYMANKQVLVVKAENANITSVDGLNIVAEVESAGEEVATTNEFFANANYIAVDTQAKALMEVAAGTADACVVDYVCSIGMIGEGTDYENLAVVESQAFADEEYGAAFRKGSDFTAKVNAAMSELKAEGKLDEIAANYKLAEQIIVK